MSDKNSHSNRSVKPLAVILLGGSGDLALKFLHPSLCALWNKALVDFPPMRIYAFADNENLDDQKLRKLIEPNLKEGDKNAEYLNHCFFFHGSTSRQSDFQRLHEKLTTDFNEDHNRYYHFAIDPNFFVAAAKNINSSARSPKGWTRVLIEKPFGRDSATAAKLHQDLGNYFTEEEMYRVDHFLAMQSVQKMFNRRFTDPEFEAILNRGHTSRVVINFKENFGIDGRESFFDRHGIIRDVMQNHLAQVLALLTMNRPEGTDNRPERLALMKAIPPIKFEDCAVGQFKDYPVLYSITPTFAATVNFIENDRWSGVPFLMKCGKGLNESKFEIHLQQRDSPHKEVIKLLPQGNDVPGEYETLIKDVILTGDHRFFVSYAEIEEEWKIFTPILQKLREKYVVPEFYNPGSEETKNAHALEEQYGFTH